MTDPSPEPAELELDYVVLLVDGSSFELTAPMPEEGNIADWVDGMVIFSNHVMVPREQLVGLFPKSFWLAFDDLADRLFATALMLVVGAAAIRTAGKS